MGSRNGSCAISHLPIRKDEEARLVLLQQSLYPDISESEGRDMMGGVAVLWRPRAIPIPGTYDGYGRIKADLDHWTVRLALARFRLDLVERPTGDRNPIHQPAVVLSEVLNGHDPSWHDRMSGLEWLQELIIKDRVQALVPAWLSEEVDQHKHVAACLIREDIYQLLAHHFTDDNYGNGHTLKQVREWVAQDVLRERVRHPELPPGDPSMDAFIEPRMIGSGRKLAEDTKALMAELGKEDSLRDEFAESLENMTLHRMRESASQFAVSYAHHLLGAGVESDDPTITSIIEEVAAFNHIEAHMAMMNLFWHPQPEGQAEAWLSHAAVALKVLELAKANARRDIE